MLQRLYGRSLDAEVERRVDVGDSTNDRAMFGHFPHSIGVANLRRLARARVRPALRPGPMDNQPARARSCRSSSARALNRPVALKACPGCRLQPLSACWASRNDPCFRAAGDVGPTDGRHIGRVVGPWLRRGGDCMTPRTTLPPASTKSGTCPVSGAAFVVLRGQDGARTSLPLEDLLVPDAFLADRLDGQPLPIAHGAPLRLAAPAHHGYKSVKHLDRVQFWRSRALSTCRLSFHGSPACRVADEERGLRIPGWVSRCVYHPLKCRPDTTLPPSV